MTSALRYLGCLLAVMITIGVIHFLPWWVLLIPVALVIVVIFGFAIRNGNRAKRDFERNGFSARLKGDDWIYEELHEGEVRSIPVLAYQIGPVHTYRIPDLSEWNTKPGWAVGRREEIIRRMSRWLKPASFRYPPDWNYTQEETEKEKAEKRSLEKYIERTKRDLRIGEPDSEWNMTFDEDGVPSVFRKTSEGENRS